jgi:GMP synthase-like glutamine amidotransferase
LVGTYGDYPYMFTELLKSADPSIETISYDVMLGKYPVDIDEVDAFLITGSKFSVYDDEEWIHRLGAFVVKLNDRKKKLLAICFGHQMVAHFLGGETAKSEKGWTVGVQRCSVTEDLAGNASAGESLNLLASHQDQVTKVANGAVTIAGNEYCPHVMTRLGDHTLTLQWHAEFIKDYFQELLKLRREIIGEDSFQAALGSLSLPIDNQKFARWAIDFMRS